MTFENELRPPRNVERGAGQTVLTPATGELPATFQGRTLQRLSDPALSELGLEDFLDELLVRVRDALEVDTVAILLLDPETDQLVARAAKGIEEEVERGVRIPLGQGFAGRIAAERVAIFVADVDHADILNPILREKGIRSLLGVPLIVEGELIGVLHVGSLKPRVFDERDLTVLQFAAGRAAPGIERARLFSALEHEHRVAIALQRSLLPKSLINVVGLAAAARYLPASEEVGGDWYDVFELPHGRLGVVIGDVVGHGLKAASLMGQLRTALHAYAVEDHSPARTLELVDRFLQGMPDFAMATAIYGVLDPETRALTLASAGHLPPILISGGKARILDVQPAPPMGAMSYGRREEHVVILDPGAILLLYTDGLVERPRVPLTESLDLLCQTVEPAFSAEDACQLGAELLPLGRLRDDVAMVALENQEISEDLELRLRAHPEVLKEVRRIMRRWLHDRGADEEVAAEIILAVNEACANAIEHAYSPSPAHFMLELGREDDAVRIIVRDTGQWRSPRGANRGRGLTIMEAAMDTVEVRQDGDGTQVTMRRRLAA